MPNNNEPNTPKTPEYQESDTKKQDQQIGAKVLSQAHFESSHKPIVESSFNKALKRGEKLPGKNDERRNLSYLTRLARLIEKHGNQAEKKLWQASIKDDLLIQYDNISEATWEAKRQEHRDNGFGNIALTDKIKHEYYREWREIQEESLEKWANYLGDERSPYPLWFKIYAWDGMTKMGRYNKGKGKYETRNETTVAPYPNPDAEVLAGVFDVINRYYGNGEKEFYTEEGERNIKLEQIVGSGSFSKIFNAIQQDIAPILEPPEKAEDVHGEWIEYKLGDENDIARAARGTGWCVASSSVGRHYLEYGTYGDDYDDDYDNYDDDYDDDYDDYDYDYDNYDDDYDDYDYDYDEIYDYSEQKQNKARFILFHLLDPKTGKLAKNACASIRLDPDGTVAEISGLKKGQALDDSLVPIVEEKAKSLPGGKEFLPKFADKNKLIALDRKMERNEDLTIEELEFLYEIHRPIQTLDTYNAYDPRVNELKQKYDIAYALDAGINIDGLFSILTYDYLIENLDTLLAHGANVDINEFVSQMHSPDIVRNLDTLIAHGANIDIDNLISGLSSHYIVRYLDTLLAHGANIDNIASSLDDYYTINHLDTLLAHGVNIDNIVSNLNSHAVADHLDTLLAHGANIDNIVSNLKYYYTIDHLDTLLAHGANIDIDNLISDLSRYEIVRNLNTLLAHGANIDNLISGLNNYDIVRNLDTLLAHGANVDINELVSQMHSSEIVENLDTLLAHGANIDIDNLISGLSSHYIVRYLDTLLAHGADVDINELISKLYYDDIIQYLDTLLAHGANIDNIASSLSSIIIVENLDTLLAHGANIDNIASSLDDYYIIDHLDTLLAHGANIGNIVSSLSSIIIVKNLDTLLAHSANIDNIVSNLYLYDIAENLDTLLAHGANIDNIVSKLGNNCYISKNLDILRRYGAKI